MYQIVVRLALANEDHQKATEFIERALALPELRTEMPKRLLPDWLLWCLRSLVRLPVVRRRARPGALAGLEPGNRAMELHAWKRWALEYFALREGHQTAPPEGAIH